MKFSNLACLAERPSGRICKLVSQYEKKSGVIDQNYIDTFNRIIWEDGVVIPMMHLGFYWMHDPSVNPIVLRSGMGMPRLDLIEYNE